MDRALVQFTQDYAGGLYKKGRRVNFSTERARELVQLGVAEVVEMPGPPKQEEPEELGLVSVTADKIFTSPALYPGDVFGVEPREAEDLVQRGAAHFTTDEDLVAFYDPQRGLKPVPKGRR